MANKIQLRRGKEAKLPTPAEGEPLVADDTKSVFVGIGGKAVPMGGENNYSTTPKRIGTWIDGSPIYRMAINRKLDDTDREDKATAIGIPNIDTMREKCTVINGFAMVQGNTAQSAYADAIDGYPARLVEFTTFKWDVDNAVAITGWVDYVQRP